VPTVDELKDEAYIIVAAAADTTGNAMTVAAYNTVLNPEIYLTLTAELQEAFPDLGAHLDFITLEKLPYLVTKHNPYATHDLSSIDISADRRYQGGT
jgi:cytochrome P450